MNLETVERSRVLGVTLRVCVVCECVHAESDAVWMWRGKSYSYP